MNTVGNWFIDDDKAADAVKAAVEIGYRHIDTAQAYGNERGVGEGVRTCGIPREELFVVSKVAAEHKTYEEAMAGINETLEKMGLDYLDMMIIHSPQPWAKVNQCEDRYVEGNRAAWKALEDAEDELRWLENLQNARKELERTQGEKTVSQKMFKAI